MWTAGTLIYCPESWSLSTGVPVDLWPNIDPMNGPSLRWGQKEQLLGFPDRRHLRATGSAGRGKCRELCLVSCRCSGTGKWSSGLKQGTSFNFTMLLLPTINLFDGFPRNRHIQMTWCVSNTSPICTSRFDVRSFRFVGDMAAERVLLAARRAHMKIKERFGII